MSGEEKNHESFDTGTLDPAKYIEFELAPTCAVVGSDSAAPLEFELGKLGFVGVGPSRVG